VRARVIAYPHLYLFMSKKKKKKKKKWVVCIMMNLKEEKRKALSAVQRRTTNTHTPLTASFCSFVSMARTHSNGKRGGNPCAGCSQRGTFPCPLRGR